MNHKSSETGNEYRLEDLTPYQLEEVEWREEMQLVVLENELEIINNAKNNNNNNNNNPDTKRNR